MVKVVLPLSAKNLSEDFIKINYNKLIFPQSLLNNTGGDFLFQIISPILLLIIYSVKLLPFPFNSQIILIILK
jgi:hypothetical protein